MIYFIFFYTVIFIFNNYLIIYFFSSLKFDKTENNMVKIIFFKATGTIQFTSKYYPYKKGIT